MGPQTDSVIRDDTVSNWMDIGSYRASLCAALRGSINIWIRAGFPIHGSPHVCRRDRRGKFVFRNER